MPSKKRIAVAIIIAITYGIALMFYVPTIFTISNTISERYSDLTKPTQPRTFQEVSTVNFQTNTRLASASDITFGYTFYYPNGTLVVDEPVTVTVKAVLKTPAAKTVSVISLGFQNQLPYPLTYDIYGVPSSSGITLTNTNNTDAFGNIVMTGQETIFWPVDGDYQALMTVFFQDGSNQPMTMPDVVFHVYPKEQLTQIETNQISLETNQASLQLSEAVLILSTVSIFALIVQILDHTQTNARASMPKKAPARIKNTPL